MSAMRTIGWLCAMTLAGGVAVRAMATANTAAPAPTNSALSAGADLWFPVGEEIVYKIYWGKIPVAESRAKSEWVEREGRRLIGIRFTTKSNKVLDVLYPVDDFIESLIDPETFLPVQFTKRLSEGRYRCHEVTTFDHETGLATYLNKRENKTKTYPIEAETRDLISFMYSMRTVDVTVGSAGDFKVMADEKLYDLSIKALKEQSVKLPKYGKIASVVLKPVAAFQGLFVRRGSMKIWVSDDDRKIITKASIKVPVAHVNLLLEDVSGPGTDQWVADRTERRISPRGSRRIRR